jgi:hypothetical protein
MSKARVNKAAEGCRDEGKNLYGTDNKKKTRRRKKVGKWKGGRLREVKS